MQTVRNNATRMCSARKGADRCTRAQFMRCALFAVPAGLLATGLVAAAVQRPAAVARPPLQPFDLLLGVLDGLRAAANSRQLLGFVHVATAYGARYCAAVVQCACRDML